MKKNKLLILGLIALVLAGGLVLASCTKCPLEGTCTSDYSTCGKSSCAAWKAGGNSEKVVKCD
ncbi:MAG: hypothetical protein LBH43_10455 [Treponema sp.]|nr:hypothetical protein [Treponema sp.]